MAAVAIIATPTAEQQEKDDNDQKSTHFRSPLNQVFVGALYRSPAQAADGAPVW
jgi:hypothetical protein